MIGAGGIFRDLSAHLRHFFQFSTARRIRFCSRSSLTGLSAYRSANALQRFEGNDGAVIEVLIIFRLFFLLLLQSLL